MTEWAFRAASRDDVEAVAELRAVVMRPDLERLGRYDEHRVRQRLRDGFAPEHTWVIEVGGAFAGCVALRPADDGHWLEHFYLAPHVQGGGVGAGVLRRLLERCDRAGTPVRLNVLQGSPARRLYERHGFTLEREDPVDVFMVRTPSGQGSLAGMRIPPLGVVERLVRSLRARGLEPAVGGSGLLVALGLAEWANDWDVTVDAPDDAVRKVLDEDGFTYSDGTTRDELYATRRRYVIDGGDHSVDLLVGFALRSGDRIEPLPTRVTGTWNGLPLADPVVWARAYELLERPAKAAALRAWLDDAVG